MEEDDDLAILTRVTEKMCGFGSEIAIGYLKKYYNEFFTGYCEVEGHNAQYFPDGKISPHAIAIAKGLSGRYYGFSPANFGVAPTNRLIDFYEANSVSKLMEIVKKQEGGEWPELNRVSDVVENPRTKDDGYLPLVEFGEDNTDPYFSGRFLRVLDEYIIERGMTQSNNLIKRMVGALDLMKLYKK